MTLKSKLFLAVSVAAIAALFALRSGPAPHITILPETIEIPAGTYDYRLAGQFRIGTHIVDAPMQQRTANTPLLIMKYTVSQTEYSVCVAANVCAPTDVLGGTNMPQTALSFHDATTYAAWFSKMTQRHWRLPTDAEWSRAAGDRFHDAALGDLDDADDPAQRWIRNYRQQALTRGPSEPDLRSRGGYGENNLGVADISGNIWEWTDTCYETGTLTKSGTSVLTSAQYCGVRAAQGKHRAYIIEFVRDARVGGCAVGIPPDYLGVRLVLDPA